MFLLPQVFRKNVLFEIFPDNINGIFGFSNYFYGHSGQNIGYPEYNITTVHESLVDRRLSKYDNGTNIPLKYAELRKLATIDSMCDAVINNQTSTIEPCNNNYCLFNIIDDPCETTGLSTMYPGILEKLIIILENHNSTVVPRTRDSFKIDPKTDPKYWNNYWPPWLDESDTNFTGNSLVYIIKHTNNVNIYFNLY